MGSAAAQSAKSETAPVASKSSAAASYNTQGFSNQRLARISASMKEQIDAGTFPGAVTVVARNGKVVHFETHGFIDAAKTRAMPGNALFRLASMTKPIVAVAAMTMVEEGRIKLQDPIVKWLPELKDLKVETKDGDVPLARPVWVQDLLRHTAGFVYAGSSTSKRIGKMYEDANIEAREVDITGDEMLKRLGEIPLAHQPGTYWEYSIASDVLGLLLERAAKQPLDVIIKERVLDPLGMRDTFWWVPENQAGRIAEALDADPQKATMLKGYRQSYNPFGKNYFKGGAGLVGTASDYVRFAQMIANGGEMNGARILSRKTIELMLSQHTVGMAGTPFSTTGPGYGFGLGFGVRLDEGMAWTPGSKGDAMWAGAWGTSFWVDPKEKLVAVLMAQTPSNRFQTRMLYKDLVYGALVN